MKACVHSLPPCPGALFDAISRIICSVGREDQADGLLAGRAEQGLSPE